MSGTEEAHNMKPEEIASAVAEMTAALREAAERADAATRRAEDSAARSDAALAQSRAQHLALQERAVRADEALAVATLAAAVVARDPDGSISGACRTAREALDLPEERRVEPREAGIRTGS